MLAAIRTALKKSMNMPPTIGMAKYATGEGPYFFVIAEFSLDKVNKNNNGIS